MLVLEVLSMTVFDDPYCGDNPMTIIQSAVVTPDGRRVRAMAERLEEARERGYLTARRGEGALRTRYMRTVLAAQRFYVIVTPGRRWASIEADCWGGNELNDAGYTAAVDMFRPFVKAAYADGYRGGAGLGRYGCTVLRIEDAPEAAARLVALYRDPALTYAQPLLP